MKKNVPHKQVLVWTVTHSEVTRLDKVILAYCHDHNLPLTRHQLHRLFQDTVKVNDEIKKKNYHVKIGDCIRVDYFLYVQEDWPTRLIPEKMIFEILYEDKTILVINKPNHLLVHPTATVKTGTLVNGLIGYTKKLSNPGNFFRVGIVHRLDKDTTGVMIIAKTNQSHHDLAQQFKNQTVRKVYLAITHGHLPHLKNKINAAIGRHRTLRDRQSVTNAVNDKRAVTYVNVRQRLKAHDLVECILETGRTHQIRVHLQFIKHPILGDHLYGYENDKNDPFCQYLHAFLIRFRHPVTKKNMTFTAPLPIFFRLKIKQLLSAHHGSS